MWLRINLRRKLQTILKAQGGACLFKVQLGSQMQNHFPFIVITWTVHCLNSKKGQVKLTVPKPHYFTW